MEIEQKQAPLIEQFVKQASTLNGSSLVNLIVEATSHPCLFAFSEILSVPNLLQLQGKESSIYIDLLRLFTHGTWTDYKSNAAHLPQLVPDQAVKLKQLSVLTLAEMNKYFILKGKRDCVIANNYDLFTEEIRPVVLSYDQLLQELEVANVRELEDFLINECMYVGIVKGKLNQLRRCFEVQFAAGRDLRHGQLENMVQSLTNWLDTSDNILSTIQEKMKWAETMCEEDKKHQMEVQNRLQDAKKSLQSKEASNQFRAPQDAFFLQLDGEMDSEEDLSRSKRKRSPKYYF